MAGQSTATIVSFPKKKKKSHGLTSGCFFTGERVMKDFCRMFKFSYSCVRLDLLLVPHTYDTALEVSQVFGREIISSLTNLESVGKYHIT